jgi:hypothetical protein
MAYTTIDDPSEHFQVKLWTGNATNRTIDLDENATMQPDFSWVKSRSNTYEHYLENSTSGTSKYLSSQYSSAENNGTVVTYNSTGFGIGSGAENNTNNTTNVGWFWKANGGTTSSNTNGNITSTVQVNTDAGFSIGSYTGNGSDNQTIGHGLGAKPDFILVKRTSAVANWVSWHKYNTYNHVLRLNLTNTESDSASGRLSADDARGSSTIFTVFQGSSAYGNVNENNSTYLFWAWKEIQGYSKFGKYIGNGDAEGSFVYTGFKPAFVIIKRRDAVNNWLIYDHKRSGYNPKQDKLYPDDASAEDASTTSVDLLSNGFKLRASSASQNASGGTYIYMAFAESPFTTSTGVPTTAR